jgi:enoyl-CoA hydratase/carnithine racemase
MKYFNENDVKNIKSYDFDFIEFEESNHVFTLTLNRPKKKNALNPQMINEIAFAFQYVSINNNKSSVD